MGSSTPLVMPLRRRIGGGPPQTVAGNGGGGRQTMRTRKTMMTGQEVEGRHRWTTRTAEWEGRRGRRRRDGARHRRRHRLRLRLCYDGVWTGGGQGVLVVAFIVNTYQSGVKCFLRHAFIFTYFLSATLKIVEVCPYRDSSVGNRDPYVGILVPTRDPLPEGTLGKLVLHWNRY
jgi:hypothetical protein